MKSVEESNYCPCPICFRCSCSEEECANRDEVGRCDCQKDGVTHYNEAATEPMTIEDIEKAKIVMENASPFLDAAIICHPDKLPELLKILGAVVQPGGKLGHQILGVPLLLTDLYPSWAVIPMAVALVWREGPRVWPAPTEMGEFVGRSPLRKRWAEYIRSRKSQKGDERPEE